MDATSSPLADVSWYGPDIIPLGVLVTKVRASSPAPIQLDQPGAQLQCLDEESFKRLCAYEVGSTLSHVHALVNMKRALAAVEQDVMAIWAAGMYEGALHVRVMARQTPPATCSPSHRDYIHHWQQILPHIWTDSQHWNAITRDTDMPDAGTPFWDRRMVGVCSINSRTTGRFRSCCKTCLAHHLHMDGIRAC